MHPKSFVSNFWGAVHILVLFGLFCFIVEKNLRLKGFFPKVYILL